MRDCNFQTPPLKGLEPPLHFRPWGSPVPQTSPQSTRTSPFTAGPGSPLPNRHGRCRNRKAQSSHCWTPGKKVPRDDSWPSNKNHTCSRTFELSHSSASARLHSYSVAQNMRRHPLVIDTVKVITQETTQCCHAASTCWVKGCATEGSSVSAKR